MWWNNYVFMVSDKDTIYIKNECLCLFQNINIHELNLKVVAMHELSYLFVYLSFLYLYSH